MTHKDDAARLAEELRADFGQDNLSPVDVFACAREIPSLTTVAYPLGENISGMCIKHDDYSLIAFNSAQTLGRQRFTVSHEFYHLFFDKDASTVICPKDTRRYNQTERMADSFASFFLLPYHALRKELRDRGLSANNHDLEDQVLLNSIIQIEQKYGISRMALLVRLQDENAITAQQKESLSHDVKLHARQLGYSVALYEPRKGSQRRMADGDYIDRLCLLFEREVISQGRAEQYLADGFRDDIWIETLEGGELVD